MVGEALRHLDQHGDEPGAPLVARALARFLVGRCEARHAGWQVLRRVILEVGADVPLVADDLLQLSVEAGRTPLSRAQHVAAQRRAEQIARHVDATALLKELGLPAAAAPIDGSQWQAALREAVAARSREQVARAIEAALLEESDPDQPSDVP
jgi:hypothetical protein